MFEGLLPREVVTRETDPRDFEDPLVELFESERLAIGGAIDRRQREFAVARILARQALTELGRPPCALLNGDDRAPIWPEGIVGSITHTREICAVALALRSNVVSVGIDIERDEPLKEELVPAVCRPAETAWLGAQAPGDRGWLGKLVFSVKECAYKVQYPISRTFLDFSAMEVGVDLAAQRWRATFTEPAGTAFTIGDTLAGRWRRAEGMVASAGWLRSLVR
jgi:4'-phosphopantetheinyl transferase EntD